jgi:hypothetical protein
VLGPVSESRLGRIMDAAQHKQQHAERLHTFLTHRADTAKGCSEAALLPSQPYRFNDRTIVPSHISTPEEIQQFSNTLARKVGCAEKWSDCSVWQERTQSTRSAYWTRLAERFTTTFAYDKHVTGRYGKVYQVTYAPKGQGLHGRNNWCPDCKEYVAMSHNTSSGLTCKQHITRRTQREAQRIARLRTDSNTLSTNGEVSASVFTRNSHTAWKDGPINTNVVEDKWLRMLDRKAGRSDSCSEQESANDGKAAPRTQHKAKRHYVRHVVTFVRQQDLNLATNI